MNTAIDTEEYDNVVPMIKPAGKGPDDKDWLSNMQPGTCFLYRMKTNPGPLLIEATFASYKWFGKIKACMIFEGDVRQGRYFWVEPFEFCRRHDLVGILYSETGQEEPEDNDG